MLNLNDFKTSAGQYINRQELKNHSATTQKPYYPLLILLLGKKSMAGFQEIYENLIDLWPSFQNEILFVGAEKDGLSISLKKLRMVQGNVEQEDLDGSTFSDQVLEMFSSDYHYSNKMNLFCVPFYSCEDFKTEEDIEFWMDVREEILQELDFKRSSIITLSIFLTRQTKLYEKLDRAIRQAIARQIETGAASLYDGFLLLGNLASDGTILRNWKEDYRIAALAIAAADIEINDITNVFLGKRVSTAAYSRADKPVTDIAQILVSTMIEFINQTINKHEITDSREQNNHFDLSDLRTFRILDELAEKELNEKLPTVDQLSLFPRKNQAEFSMDPAYISYQAFNEETMGAWECLLDGIIQETLARIEGEEQSMKKWSQLYADEVTRKLTINNMTSFADQQDSVRERFSTGLPKDRTGMFHDNESVLKASRDRMKLSLSNDTLLSQNFAEALIERGGSLHDFYAAWNRLYGETIAQQPVADKNLESYYQKMMESYLRNHEESITADILQVRNTEELQKRLENTLRNFIESNEIFALSFDRELQKRLENAANADFKKYISNMLSENRRIYLNTFGSLGDPILSMAIVDRESEIYPYLKNILDRSFYFYDTVSGRSAETLLIYELGIQNLTA